MKMIMKNSGILFKTLANTEMVFNSDLSQASAFSAELGGTAQAGWGMSVASSEANLKGKTVVSVVLYVTLAGSIDVKVYDKVQQVVISTQSVSCTGTGQQELFLETPIILGENQTIQFVGGTSSSLKYKALNQTVTSPFPSTSSTFVNGSFTDDFPQGFVSCRQDPTGHQSLRSR